MIDIRRRYVYEDVDRWGNVRLYFWRGRGHRKVRLLDRPGTAEFDRHYHELVRQVATGELKVPARDVPAAGTFRWMCVEHFKSVAFKQLDPRTQHVTRLVVEKMFLEPIAPGAKELFADCPLHRFGPAAVRILRDRRADRPEAANNRLRRLRRIFAWALETDLAGVNANPAREVPLLRPNRAGGFPCWSQSDIERFEARHPVGSRPRLALSLLIYTGVRRSDVVRLGKQHVRGGTLRFLQHKGRNRSPITLELPILPALHDVIAVSPTGDMTFLVTERGRPFSAPSFTNWFRDRCNEAGLPHLSAHGLRKAGATRAAENGATAHQLMAIFGWRTIKQAEVYTRAAERGRLAGEAMHLLGTNRVEKFPTTNLHAVPVGKTGAKD
jgi:integrase